MNSKISKTSDLHRLLLNSTGQINLKISDKYVALSNFGIYNTRKIIKKPCKNKKFKISAPTWNEAFELPEGSYSVSDIQYYLEDIFIKHGEKTDNSSIRIYVNKIEIGLHLE